MICVTGAESSPEALEARLTARSGPQAPGLHEVRLDKLQRLDAGIWPLLRRHGPRLLVCCRPAGQGGEWADTEADRLAVLERAAGCGVAWLDAESDLPDEALARLRGAGAARLVLSHHEWQSGAHAAVRERLESIARRGADLVKLAIRIEDAADLESLRQAGSSLGRPAVVIGMGAAGLLSRTRYPAFGSAWTYVAASPGDTTAPGQLTLQQSDAMGLPDTAQTPFLALLGGEQVLRSPGPQVYNRLFRRLGLPYSYVPVVSARPAEALELLRRLGALGASITMPHKQSVLRLPLAQPDSTAARIGAANTVRFEPDAMKCTNTDADGIAGPLGQALQHGKATRALILGAGGAARAAVLACARLGLDVAVCARNPDAVGQWPEAPAAIVDWEARTRTSADVLINATPLGGELSPWPADRPLDKSVVFDLALAGGGPSQLLRQAQQEGATALGPHEMWLVQGARQMRWLTGLDVAPDDLRKELA